MMVSYYNLAKHPEHAHGRWNKKKLLTFTFRGKHLEMIQFENSDRGHLLWICTPETVRVWGFWKDKSKFYMKWHNDHVGCC